MSRLRYVPLLLAMLLPAAPGRSEQAVPSRLPADVAPLPPKSAEHLDELLHAAEKYRGLKAKQPVPAGSVGPRGVEEKVAGTIGKEWKPEDLRALEVSLKAFGLIPETLDLRRYIPELLSSQVAGFYDPERKYLALVGPAGGALPKGMPEGAEDMVLVHELAHALQDQSFDLHRFESTDPMSDAGTALTALTEGDATLVMLDYQAGMKVETLPQTAEVMTRMMKDPEKLIAGSPDFPGAKEMAAAPVWFRDTLLFSYFQGSVFCVSAKRRGGQPLLDYAFTTDPPRSTEQILHPEKWHTRRDDPVAVHLPDFTGELPGYRKAAEGVMGELSLRIYLRQGLKNDERADAAAAGWGGDRFAVYEKEGGGRLIAWVADWDTEADAGEFRSALESLEGWRVEAAGPRRVVALRGSLPPERWAAVRARLATAEAERPANKEIDLKAIGASPTEMGADDVKALLKNPAFRKGFEEGRKRNRERELPAGEVGADGRVYTNPALGLSIRLPEALSGWTLDGTPKKGAYLLKIVSPGSEAVVVANFMDVPEGTPLEMLDISLNGIFESMLPGYHALRTERAERSGVPFRSTWFEADIKGQKMTGVQRFAPYGSRIFFFFGMARRESWERYEPAVLQILDTVTLVPAPPPGAPSPADGR